MPVITQSDNAANSLSVTSLEMDEFIPIVRFKDPVLYIVEDEKIKIEKTEVELSAHIDEDKRTIKLHQLETRKRKLKIPFLVKQGSEASWDENGFIEVKSSIEDKDIKFLSSTKFLTTYDSDFEVELEIAGEEGKQFFLDFYANDDEDDYNKGEYENVHCGRFQVLILEAPSKVGLRLTSNIESLPKAPTGYVDPPTYSDPEASFKVANKYQNCGGMCFAVSMARVKQAYLDEFNVDVIDLNVLGQDYFYSGTVINNIPDNIFGYGVGAALYAKGYAELVDHDGVWNGDLKEGAMIQYWWGDDLNEIKNRIKRRVEDDQQDGHSVIFKSYIYDSEKNIVGMKYYDYSGTNRTFGLDKDSDKIFLGANIKDIKPIK